MPRMWGLWGVLVCAEAASAQTQRVDNTTSFFMALSIVA
jgi:hypothetical protein